MVIPNQKIKLNEIANFSSGKFLSKERVFESGSIPIWGSNGIIGYCSEPLYTKPVITIGRVGACGEVHKTNGPAWISDNALVVEPKDNTDFRFLYYSLKTFDFSSLIGGTTQPLITQTAVKEQTILFPPIPEQRAIAHILGTLDDKIELNRRMNETLEAMAQALFKSWFVDFDPVRAKMEGRPTGLPKEIEDLFPDSFEDSELGEIPRGWKFQALYDIADFINGAAFRDFNFTEESGGLPVVKIAEIKNGVSGQTKFTKTKLADKYRIKNGDILFSWSGNPDTSIDTFVWTEGEGWLNQHIFRVCLKSDEDRYFVYYQLKMLRPFFAEIARNKQTTGLGHITVQDMKRLFVLKCPPKVGESFNNFVGPMFTHWYVNLLLIKDLEKLRDSLLPKLLSGEMGIQNPEIILESFTFNKI